MKYIIILFIYLVGCVVAYLFCKRIVVKEIGKWTKGNRAFVIFAATFSWLTFASALIVEYLESFDSNKPAKW